MGFPSRLGALEERAHALNESLLHRWVGGAGAGLVFYSWTCGPECKPGLATPQSLWGSPVTIAHHPDLVPCGFSHVLKTPALSKPLGLSHVLLFFHVLDSQHPSDMAYTRTGHFWQTHSDSDPDPLLCQDSDHRPPSSDRLCFPSSLPLRVLASAWSEAIDNRVCPRTERPEF